MRTETVGYGLPRLIYDSKKEGMTMDNKTREYVASQAEALLKTHACKEAKQACESWLKKQGSQDEKEASIGLLKELKEDIVPIDGLLEFAHSDRAEAIFGHDGHTKFIAHCEDLKKSGALYCDCLACKAALNIVSKEKDILSD